MHLYIIAHVTRFVSNSGDRSTLSFKMVITKLQLENKLEEYKKIDNLYDVAISVHEKTISDAKKGKLRFTQISDPKLYGLLYGDLKRLNADQEKIKQEITELQDQLRAQPSPILPLIEPETSVSDQVIDLGQPEAEIEKESSVRVADEDSSSVQALKEVTFTPDLTTPDIFLDRGVTETLSQLGCDLDSP